MTRTLGSVRKLTNPSTTVGFLNGKGVINAERQRLVIKRSQSYLPKLCFRTFAHVRQEPVGSSATWFTPSLPAHIPADDLLSSTTGPHSQQDHRPPDERTLRLGKTLRALVPLLPNVFTQPLPPSILSPEISLHLFPSTHPHLPAVKGKVAYRAALWTAPVAWGSVPLVGNVKLDIVSEKIVRTGHISQSQFNGDPSPLDLGEERLVVRWKTKRKPNNGTAPHSTASNSSSSSSHSPLSTSTSNSSIGINRGLSQLLGGDQPIFSRRNSNEDFTGLFIFTFDGQGRVATHTIEHADECGGADRQRTSRVITLTEWLLGRAKWNSEKEEEMIPGLAMSRLRVCRAEAEGRTRGGERRS